MDDFPVCRAKVAHIPSHLLRAKTPQMLRLRRDLTTFRSEFPQNFLSCGSVVLFEREIRSLPFGLQATRCEFTPNVSSFILLIPRNVCATPVEHADLVTASSISAGAAAARSGNSGAAHAAHRNERRRVEPEANSLQAAIK